MTPIETLRERTRKSLDAAVEMMKAGASSDNALFHAGRCSAYSETLFNIDEHLKDDAVGTPLSPDKQNVPVWRWAKAGTTFPSEALVVSQEDRDPHLVKTAVYDCWYILVDDLLEGITFQMLEKPSEK